MFYPVGVVIVVPLEFGPPKYAVVVNTIQQRILDGTYAPGSAIPSEAQLMTVLSKAIVTSYAPTGVELVT